MLAAFLLALSACTDQTPRAPPSQPVDALKYDAFWVWSGSQDPAILKRAKTIYALQAEVSGAPGRFKFQGLPVDRNRPEDIWLVFRVETLDWSPEVIPLIVSRWERWVAAGNKVQGIQIDFDAGSHHLDRYASFLKSLRAALPKDCKLSITGLLDWSRTGDVRVLNGLRGDLDEIVIQTYQGRHTVPGYRQYLGSLKALELPFKIGLVQGGEWQEPTFLRSHGQFRGYVVFLHQPQH